MRLTVLGGCGAWPQAGQACSGFLVEHDGFALLVEAGYGVVPRLLGQVSAGQVGAAYISHGHPDHCADLNPLLRARAMGGERLPPLPVYALPGALDAVLALDRPETLAGSYELHDLRPGTGLEIGPFRAASWLLPHWMPNAGLRLEAAGQLLAYTGDSGPDPQLDELARGVGLLVAEATYVSEVPASARGNLSSAAAAGQLAARVGAGQLLLTHLWPGTEPSAARAAAASAFGGPVSVAVGGTQLTVG